MNGSQLKHHTVGADFTYRFTDANADVSGFFDAVVEHLEKIDAEDIFVAIDHKARTFNMSLLVTSAADAEADQVIAQGMGTMRTAFHACGAATPNWPMAHETVCSVELASVNAIMNEDAPGELVTA